MATDKTTALPDWLTSNPDSGRRDTALRRTTGSTVSEVVRPQFPAAFESLLDKVRAGASLKDACADDHRSIAYGEFMAWVMSSGTRKQRYYEAKAVAAEIVFDALPEMAEGGLEDVARSSLKVNTARYMLGVLNRKRFSEVKSIDVNETKDTTVTFVLQRPGEGRPMSVIEGEAREILPAVDDTE